jgi:ubiquitin-like-conjugating enzyme ATG3
MRQNGSPLTPQQIFEDVSAEHAFKTVTIEPFPHSASLQAASVHPCKHADVMKKVIERMNSTVVAAQLAQQQQQKGTSSKATPAAGSSAGTQKKGSKWLFRRTSGKEVPQAGSTPSQESEEPVEGMRVDFYLVVFLKFIASIVPTIEVDSTTAF